MKKKSKRVKKRESGRVKKIRLWLEKYGAPTGVVLVILLIALSFFLPKNQFQQAKERLVRNPKDFEAHLMLAEEYLKNNQLDEAEKELLLAEKNLQSNQLWQKKMESSPEEIRILIGGWEKIVAEKPNYRDGYLKLALLYYKLYENEKAREYLQKALELDPNFKPARKLEKILSD